MTARPGDPFTRPCVVIDGLSRDLLDLPTPDSDNPEAEID